MYIWGVYVCVKNLCVETIMKLVSSLIDLSLLIMHDKSNILCFVYDSEHMRIKKHWKGTKFLTEFCSAWTFFVLLLFLWLSLSTFLFCFMFEQLYFRKHSKNCLLFYCILSLSNFFNAEVRLLEWFFCWWFVVSFSF